MTCRVRLTNTGENLPIMQKKIRSGQVGLLSRVLPERATILEENQKLLTKIFKEPSSEQRLKACLKRRAPTHLGLSLKSQWEGRMMRLK